MKKIIIGLLIFVVAVFTSIGSVYAQNAQATATTDNPTNIKDTSATLYGNVQNVSSGSAATVWFQYGSDINYGFETDRQTKNNADSFSQEITGLSPNATYHFRAVAQDQSVISYGEDKMFTTTSAELGAALIESILSVKKSVINLTANNLTWQPSVSARPGDVLSFAITLQAGSRELHNVVVKDTLPPNLIYKGNLTINAVLNSADNPMSSSGINIGTIPAGEIEVIAYQVQVASTAENGTLANNVTVTSTEAGTQTASALANVSQFFETPFSGALDIPTGITNNPFVDSFLLPILLIVLFSRLYFTGSLYRFSDWIKARL